MRRLLCVFWNDRLNCYPPRFLTDLFPTVLFSGLSKADCSFFWRLKRLTVLLKIALGKCQEIKPFGPSGQIMGWVNHFWTLVLYCISMRSGKSMEKRAFCHHYGQVTIRQKVWIVHGGLLDLMILVIRPDFDIPHSFLGFNGYLTIEEIDKRRLVCQG